MINEFKKIKKYFVGFWKYQAYSRKGIAKTCSYCVTICVNGNHIDTHTHKNPIKAFEEAVKIINRFAKRSRSET